jgi:hypothetical protein
LALARILPLRAAYENMAEANLSFRMNTADIGASLGDLAPTAKWDTIKIKRVIKRVKNNAKPSMILHLRDARAYIDFG